MITEPCKFCASPIPVASVENELVPIDEYGDAYCNADCLQAHEDAANERNYERFIEDFYGSSKPVTIEEQYQAAAEEKRKIG